MVAFVLATLLFSQIHQNYIEIPALGIKLLPPRGWTQGVHHSFGELRGVFLSPQGARMAVVAGRKGEVKRQASWLASLKRKFRKMECSHGSMTSSSGSDYMFVVCRRKDRLVTLATRIIHGTPVLVSFRCEGDSGLSLCKEPFRQYQDFASRLLGLSLTSGKAPASHPKAP